MKPYFAKYLVVEGEIKDGERGISINNALYTHQEHLGPNYGKPVKLFICSRDIQVGDKMESYVPVGQLPYKVEKGEAIKYNKELDTWDYKCEDGSITICGASFCYKVIGEISLEAIWVKEGDEFDEDEISRNVAIANPFGEVSWYNKPLLPEPVLNVRNEHGYTYISTRIEIKCPTCRKFH